MQQLQNASELNVCARSVLETVLEVLVTIRENCARHHEGPTLVQMRAMGVLHKRPGANLSMLSDQLALTLSATSRLVDSLVKQGLVVRTVPKGNRRSVALRLASPGKKSLDALMRETQCDLAASLRSLSARQRRELCQSLECLRRVIESTTPAESAEAKRPAPRHPA